MPPMAARCPSGMYDSTDGVAFWWTCAKDCPGGAYATACCTCACQSYGVVPTCDKGTTMRFTPTPTPQPTAAPSAKVWSASTPPASAPTPAAIPSPSPTNARPGPSPTPPPFRASSGKEGVAKAKANLAASKSADGDPVVSNEDVSVIIMACLMLIISCAVMIVCRARGDDGPAPDFGEKRSRVSPDGDHAAAQEPMPRVAYVAHHVQQVTKKGALTASGATSPRSSGGSTFAPSESDEARSSSTWSNASTGSRLASPSLHEDELKCVRPHSSRSGRRDQRRPGAIQVPIAHRYASSSSKQRVQPVLR